jgi:hypothetical protein
VVQLHRDLDKIHAAGAEVFVIGNGSPSFIEGFRDETKWTGAIYTDPSLAVYKAAELKRGVARTFNPLALGGTVKAFMAGNRQGKTQGDPWQQGGTLVVATDGTVIWHHISGNPDDRSTGAEIVDVLSEPRRAQS